MGGHRIETQDIKHVIEEIPYPPHVDDFGAPYLRKTKEQYIYMYISA